MMAAGKLLSQLESAEIAGVSEDTIRQYSEFGLLDTVEQAGEVLYREADIRSIFYTKDPGISSSESNKQETATPITPPSATSNESQEAELTPKEDLRANTASDEERAKEEASAALSTQKLAEASQKKTTTQEQKSSTEENDKNDDESHAQGFTTLDSVLKETESGATDRENSWEREPQTTGGSYRYNSRSGSSLELMEANRSLRSQIELLREERDWLRRRVEKLENQTEREQMLLLAESETVRSLIKGSERNRSFWNFALPWFGSTERTK